MEKTVSKCEIIMKQRPDTVKTFPLPDSHLHGAAVLACSVADHMRTVTDCERCAESLSHGVAELRLLLFEFSDLLTRQDTALQLAVAAREHPSFRVPDWFFRAESGDPRAMLTRRARYLRGAKVDIDQTWDLLREFAESCHHVITDGELAAIIEAAYAGKGGR